MAPPDWMKVLGPEPATLRLVPVRVPLLIPEMLSTMLIGPLRVTEPPSCTLTPIWMEAVCPGSGVTVPATSRWPCTVPTCSDSPAVT